MSSESREAPDRHGVRAFLRAWGLRLAGLFGKERKDRELAAELDAHLQMHVDENISRGMTLEEARRDALIKLGGLEQTKEKVRERRGVPFLESLLADIRFGLRMLRKSPGFTAVAVLTLALGIGATTAIFSLVNAVMIRSLPYRDAGRLVYLWENFRNAPHTAFDIGPTYADFYDIQRQAVSFSSLAMIFAKGLNVAGEGSPQRVGGAGVTADFFPILGVAPLLGRTIDAYDDERGHDRVAVIGYALWQENFGGDASVLNRMVTADGKLYRIVGVMPPGFSYPRASDFGLGPLSTQIWFPEAVTPQQKGDRRTGGGSTIGRLRPGVSVRSAQAEMDTIMARLDKLHDTPGATGWYVTLMPLSESAIGDVRLLLWLLFGTVSLVLLIACSNTASLLLARAASRQGEMAVRAALGAERARLIRQMMTESALLALGGGMLGVLLAHICIRVLVRLGPGDIPRLEVTTLDTGVLLFCFGISLLTTFLFGILPSVAASRTRLDEWLRQSGGRAATSRIRQGLIISEIGLAVVLLIASGLLIHSYLKLQNVDAGFSRATMTMDIWLDSNYAQPEERQVFFRNFLDDLKGLNGSPTVGAISALPLSGNYQTTLFQLPDLARERSPYVDWRIVTEDYFTAMGVPLIEGRPFDAGDTADRPLVVIVNERFAELYFQSEDPIGREVRLFGRDTRYPWRRVVGVVRDVHDSDLESAPGPQIYVPLWQSYLPVPGVNFSLGPSRAFIAIRTSVPPAQLASAVRKTIQGIDPALAISDIQTMGERVDEANARRRFQTLLLTVFAMMALFLAAVGIYGLLAYSVKQRTAEIGIRMAMGARQRDVLGLVIGQGMRLVVIGICIGVAGALGVTHLLASLLFGVKPTDPVAFIGVVILLLVVAALACYMPARRAAKVDPMLALRYE